MKVRVCLVIVLVIWVAEQQVRTQCYTENILGTMTGSVELNQEDFSMKDLLGSLLDLMNTAKKEGFVKLKDKHVRTSPGDLMCSVVGEGIDIQALSDYNRTLNLPILTSARVIGKKIMIRGRKRSTLLDPDLMATLLKSVNIDNHITLDGHPAISFINEGGTRMLINFDQMRPNVCEVEPDVMGLGTQATLLLSEIAYSQLIKINSLF